MFNFNHGKPERYIVYAGVFPPGTVPPPDLEVYTRSAEKWEGTFEGCKAFEAGAQ
ncbi:uncharacterized protein EHS24_007043 [Apiotrichum porosum]|uniref:Uncharacterized protein n=1 Tax=Apiotrichum porosum TaxID=105984 RepID=A0A427XX00_9TREE|nr:uncharacterized protein EHS24_007043 [Apiotrichum porosum]RSH83363.1 hypothetical protein EHS24_007043 [Apiotrichum porosum]